MCAAQELLYFRCISLIPSASDFDIFLYSRGEEKSGKLLFFGAFFQELIKKRLYVCDEDVVEQGDRGDDSDHKNRHRDGLVPEDPA